MKFHQELTDDNEFYLYLNGKLIYKKWLDTGASKVFDVMAYDKYTYASYSDLDVEDSPFVIRVRAKVRFLPPDEGGRSIPVYDGYRPNHVFEYDDQQNMIEAFMGVIDFNSPEHLELGQEYEVNIRFVMTRGLENHLEAGRKWWMHEGPFLVGEAELLSIEK
ncbi:hypothetical protein [Lewinella sp. W8]|uniref:hypothetical protein n=1 Tax=Lewinella sp. W8 TaxID=2528208 RepID=UPI001067ADCB|nr:hypothetical protein [Lewinella sp. W8]MTB50752.1 hypothetical protein [Lewinella sp. W8]